MFNIMLVSSHRDDYGDLYRFLTTTVDGVVKPVEIENKEELDKKVEKMLNEEGYAKDDFIVVRVIDYKIDAREYAV